MKKEDLLRALNQNLQVDGYRNDVLRLVKGFLAVGDSIQRMLEAAGDDLPRAASLRTLAAQFDQVLGSVGVERIATLGGPLDPDRHKVVELRVSTETEPDEIIAEELAGYLYQGQVIRPAEVVVSRTS